MLSHLTYLIPAYICFSFELCSNTSGCYDAVHKLCLFQINKPTLRDCLFGTGTADVETCQSASCHALNFASRRRWRHAMRTIYRNAGELPCYSLLPFLLATPPVAATVPEVSVTMQREVPSLNTRIPLHKNTYFSLYRTHLLHLNPQGKVKMISYGATMGAS